MLADGGYRGNPEAIMPYRRARDGSELPEWKQDYTAGHRVVRARVEHALARLKTYKILRDYRRAGRTLAPTTSGSPICTTSFSQADAQPLTGTPAPSYETSPSRSAVPEAKGPARPTLDIEGCHMRMWAGRSPGVAVSYR